MKIKYIQNSLGEEQRAIAGGYTAQEHLLLPFQDSQVFCVMGNVCLDTSCCGSGSWSYIQVVGYLLTSINHEKKNLHSDLEIDTIEEQKDKTALRQILADKYPGARIEFR